ncbi:synaptotagmin-2 isoform X2 [Heterodontus francisci]|uniref:synaptotagmin-2 isoform X2 n=1 Tax=Heterodontus francisci TaxID=7792 RepID=UPI00355B4BB2
MGNTSKFLAVIQNLNIHLGYTMKIGLLGAAGLFLLVSMIILGWQICLYCKHRKTKKTKAKKAVGGSDPKKQYTEKSNLSTRSNSTDFLGMSDEDEHSDVKKQDYKLFTSSPRYQHILHQWDTKIVKNTRNPSFGDQFTCSIEKNTCRKATLKLEVWDFDKYSRRDVLGEVRMSFSNLELSNTVEFCEELQKVQKELVGEIFLSLKYLPTARKLEVALLKVKTGCLSNSPDTGIYTRVDFYVNQHKVKHQKTPTKPKSEITVFNEVILFTVSDSVINQSMVITSVYETSLSKDSARHLLGRAYVGRKKSKEDDHWLSMLQSLRQPVSKWHPLLI